MHEVKRCSSCREVKPLDSFNKNAKAKDGKQARCRSCCKAWYESNREKHVSNVTANKRRRIKENQFLLIRYLQRHPCIVCGESDVVVLEFDHRDPANKRDSVCRLLSRGESWDVVRNEINKCDVLCANCHRRKTNKQFDYYRNTFKEKFLDEAPAVTVTEIAS